MKLATADFPLITHVFYVDFCEKQIQLTLMIVNDPFMFVADVVQSKFPIFSLELYIVFLRIVSIEHL